jgi:trans-feruloyl-CoA hydratase/vanillin synthase
MNKTMKTIKVETDTRGIAVLTLNRPEKRNAMNPQLNADMTEMLELLRYDATSRVIVITGAGDAFCSGMDMKEFFADLKDQPAEFDRITRLSNEWRGRTLRNFPKPLIAMINGYCFGGAFAIAEGCDLAVAAEEAKFGLSEINFKHFPAGSVSKSLANLLRPRDALFYAMTGRPFDGIEAARIGLVNYAVPKAELEANVLAVAAEIATKDPIALKCAKEAYRNSLRMDYDAAMSYADAKVSELTLSQNNAWRATGVGDFVAGKTRPGLGGEPKD